MPAVSRRNPEAVPTRKLAISYARVSTGTQARDEASGIERQEQAIAAWLKAHPEFELDREIRHVGSGAEAGRFEWFIEELRQGRLPQGTCLVVEKMSRLGREPLDETLDTLLSIFKAGGAVAVCSLFGGEVLRNLKEQRGAVYQLAGAIDAARIEYEDKRDRALGSNSHQRRLIADGRKPFRPRQKGKRTQYPFWLDFDPKIGDFKPNVHADWVKQSFIWSQEVGAKTIAKRLKELGIRSPSNRRKTLSPERINGLLSDRAVLGERQNVDARGKPIGDPILGVYPPIVSVEEWKLARAAIKSRTGAPRSNGSQHHNLFEGQIFCSHCGSLIGVRRSKRLLSGGIESWYPYLRCRAKERDKSNCSSAASFPYDEELILKRLQDFRWADLFSDKRHEDALTLQRELLLQAERSASEAEQKIRKVLSAQDDWTAQGRAWPTRLDDQLHDAERELAETQVQINLAALQLQSLKRRRTGKAAQSAIQKKVMNFIAAERNDVAQRSTFIRWLSAERLVIEFNLETGAMEFGVGEVAPGGHLVGLDQRMEDAAGFGIPIEEFRAFIEERDSAVGN